MSNTSRRDLLKGAALAGLGSAPIASSALGVPPPKDQSGSHWERPAAQTGNNLNLILLVSDTFRADNLAAYGSKWIETPNLNRFAEQSVIFEDAYPEGMPTIPIRRTLYTGRRIVPISNSSAFTTTDWRARPAAVVKTKEAAPVTRGSI